MSKDSLAKCYLKNKKMPQKKKKNGQEQYKNLPEDEKQRLVEYEIYLYII